MTIVLGLALAGCGSGDETTTGDTVADRTVPADADQARPDARNGYGAASDGDEDGDKQDRPQKSDEKPGRDGGSSQKGDPSGGDPRDQSSDDSPRRQRVERKLEDECPAGVGKASCKALVEDYIDNGKDSKGTVVAAPGDCAQVMSEEECEAALQAQKAEEDSPSVVVEECLAHPTPRCEEILLPILEQQRAAGQAGG